jgi:hypothetical protein
LNFFALRAVFSYPPDGHLKALSSRDSGSNLAKLSTTGPTFATKDSGKSKYQYTGIALAKLALVKPIDISGKNVVLSFNE